MAGELAAFPGLGTLGHLNFELVRIDEVVGGNTETTGSDLLDIGAGGVAVRVRLEAHGIFTAFTGIRFSADAVHRNGEGFVSLG